MQAEVPSQATRRRFWCPEEADDAVSGLCTGVYGRQLVGLE